MEKKRSLVNFAGLLVTFVLAAMSQTVHGVERISYYHNDHLGSPVVATNPQGAVVWRESYQPYGTREHQGGNQNSLWFTGKQKEASFGVSYFGARWYDPEIGRFLAMDPVGVSVGNMLSFNRYAYANNNPYGFVDPDGRDAIATFRRDGNISIEMPIKFLGKAVSEANVSRTKKDISKRLSGTYTINGKATKVDVTVSDPKSTGKINYVTLTPGEISRNSCGGCSFVSGRQFGEWNMSEIYSDDGVAPHEAVHLMGGGDHYDAEYENGIRISTTPKQGFKGNIMGDLNGTIDHRNFKEILSSEKNDCVYEK